MISLRELVNRIYVRYLLPIPSPHLLRLRLLSPVDLPYLISFGPRRWWDSVTLLREFRRNLQLTHWTSLSDIYPRPLMFLVYYMLTMWARYCGVLEAVVTRPDGCIVAELFIRYNCEIDAQVDRASGRPSLQHDPLFPKRAPATQAIASELWRVLHGLNLPRAAEREAIRLIQNYRHTFLGILRRTAVEPIGSLSRSQVFGDKARVAGDLWGVWSRILGVMYGVPHPRADEGAEIMHAFGMAIQVVDDLADLPRDVADGQPNLFSLLVDETPDERRKLEARMKQGVRRFLEAGWVRANLPRAYARAEELIDGYLATIERIDRERRVSVDARHCAHVLLRVQG